MMDYPEQNNTERQAVPGTEEQRADDAQQRMPVVRQLTVIGVLLLALLSGSAIPQVIAKLDTTEQDANVATPPEEPASLAVADPAAFDDVTVSATSAFVWDVRTQRVLYEKNPDEQLPLASITKLMTALVAYEITTRDTAVAVDPDATRQDGDSGLASGERFTLGALADLTLMTSSNDGAYAIATAAGSLLDAGEPTVSFVKAMNIRADELGLSQTYFRNPTGLDITESEAGAYGSARDIAFLLEHIVAERPEILEATTEPAALVYNEDGAYHEAENTNYAVRNIPGLIGSKTGYTTLAGGNLAVAFDVGVNRPIIVVVLGSTYDGRFTDVLTLANATRDALSE